MVRPIHEPTLPLPVPAPAPAPASAFQHYHYSAASPTPKQIIVRTPSLPGCNPVLTLATDPDEIWSELCRRVLENDFAANEKLLSLLRDIFPQKRLSAYRLRFDCGFGTIVRPTWADRGSANVEAESEDAFADIKVWLTPAVKNNNEKWTVPPEFIMHQMVLSSLEGAACNEKNNNVFWVDLRWALTWCDGVGAVPYKKGMSHALFMTESEGSGGYCLDRNLRTNPSEVELVLPSTCVNASILNHDKQVTIASHQGCYKGGRGGHGGGRRGGKRVTNETSIANAAVLVEKFVEEVKGRAPTASGNNKRASAAVGDKEPPKKKSKDDDDDVDEKKCTAPADAKDNKGVGKAENGKAPNANRKRAKENMTWKKKNKGPKVPPSAFQRYTKKVCAKIKMENPNLDQNQLKSKIKNIWVGLSEEERRPYKDEADAGLKRFNEAQRGQTQSLV